MRLVGRGNGGVSELELELELNMQSVNYFWIFSRRSAEFSWRLQNRLHESQPPFT